jgi:hypothetical protein
VLLLACATVRVTRATTRVHEMPINTHRSNEVRVNIDQLVANRVLFSD